MTNESTNGAREANAGSSPACMGIATVGSTPTAPLPIDIAAIKARAWEGWAVVTESSGPGWQKRSEKLDWRQAKIDGPILVAAVERLRKALEAAKLRHDHYHGCPTAGRDGNDDGDPAACDCAAGPHNAKIDKALAGP